MPRARTFASEKASFADNYDSFFEVVLADTRELLDRVHKIRYQVYCVEKPFEDPAENPGGYELDAYDERSVHSLLIHRQSGEIAGTVRLILPSGDAGGPDFPIQTACADLCVWPEQLMPAASTAEISRFTISKQFRRRVSDTLYADAGMRNSNGIAKPRNRRLLPEVTIGLLRAIVQMSRENGITHWCAIMEPTLLRLLSRMGVYLDPVGALVEYHGWRQPCHGKFAEVFEALRQRRPEIWYAVAR